MSDKIGSCSFSSVPFTFYGDIIIYLQSQCRAYLDLCGFTTFGFSFCFSTFLSGLVNFSWVLNVAYAMLTKKTSLVFTFRRMLKVDFK